MDTSDKHFLADHRMKDMNFTKKQMDFIWADWPNWDEHLDWLLIANKQEILDWIPTEFK